MEYSLGVHQNWPNWQTLTQTDRTPIFSVGFVSYSCTASLDGNSVIDRCGIYLLDDANTQKLQKLNYRVHDFREVYVRGELDKVI